MTILIAEDDKYSALLLNEFLKGDNITIHHVVKGNDAVQYCQNKPVDLVLMDIKLPDISGFNAVKQIKKYNPKQIIIAQTACATPDEVEKINNSCFNAYILKPFKKTDLLNLIHSV